MIAIYFRRSSRMHKSRGAEIAEALICLRMFGAVKQWSQSVSAGCQFEFLVCLQDLRDESTDIKTQITTWYR